MSILYEIHKWSQNLSDWQKHAIARLYENREVADKDLDDIYALAKAEAGIEDPEKRQPKILLENHVASQPIPSRLVQLTAIKELSNINALADGEKLPISANGLTVIYGENGAGKSGYSRALKHACRARDRREPILPNARIDRGVAGPSKAVFEAVIDGEPVDLPWQYRKESPEPLSEIAIFDTHCARAYVDNEGDFAYAPYGLDILGGLVTVCNKLKDRASKEKIHCTPTDAAYSALTKDQTIVGRALMGIPRKTKAADIEALAVMSDAERERLDVLTKTLNEPDARKKAQELRQKASRLTRLAERISAAIAVINPAQITELQRLVEASNAAKRAAELAANDFRNTPGQLPGTGGEEWKALFEAARVFARISHKDHNFPNLPDDSQCPLCQNQLDSQGSQRLIHFEAFIEQAAEKAAKNARSTAATAYKLIEQAELNLLIDETLAEELDEISPELAAETASMQIGIKARQAATIKAAAGKIAWHEIDILPKDPSPSISSAVGKLIEQAKTLEETANEAAKAALIKEHAELYSRNRLIEIKAAVLEAISKHEYCAKLQKCIDGMGTAAISRKSTELSRTIASQELADTLTAELKRLKVNDLQVVMKPESPGGKTQFKLTLQLPGGGIPSAILSEGEQRAIAIGSFMAEVKLSKGQGGIVFDDPVSSLDHRRRWEVAERLAAEAKNRQVIIFTHDIYFLCILEQKADELRVPITKQYIRKTSKGFGVYSQDLPFDVLGTRDRIGRLRNMLVEVRRAQKNGNEDDQRSLTRETYGHLRLAWERSIEEVLFNESIKRFGEGVSTQNLRRVTVTDDDYKLIDAGMTKSSKFEHDAATHVGRLPIPDPDEIEADIKTLDDWRKTVISRRDAVAAAR